MNGSHLMRLLAVVAIAALSGGCGGPGIIPGASPLAAASGSEPAPLSRPSQSGASVAPNGSPATSAASTPDSSGQSWLAYQSYDVTTHIRLVHPDGSADHLLVDGAHPDWSPDGKQLAYQVDSMDIWVIDADGAKPHKVFDCKDPCILGDSPAWSPDGRSLAFSTANKVNGEAPGSRVVSLDVATGTIATLVETVGPEYAFYPRWSSDGRSIVVSIQRFATKRVDDCSPVGTAIAVVDLAADHHRPRLLTEFPMYADYPDWSPDGNRIVFSTYDLGTRDFGCALDASPPSDLYTIRPDGKDLSQLTHNSHGSELVRPVRSAADPQASPRGTASGPLSGQPTWAPDGKSIIFVQVDGPTWPGWQVWTVSADGSNAAPTPFAGPPLAGTHPRWQPMR